MANKSCLARLRKELRAFDAPPYVVARPLETNLQEWRYVLQGPPDSPFKGGLYQGKLRFPDDFPFKPPSIYMLTPNGRFKTDQRLCLSMSDFHPETWVPTWSVSTILNGVLSFWLSDEVTNGSLETDLETKTRLRDQSVAFNAADPVFCKLFPELVEGKPFYKASPSADATAETAGDETSPVLGDAAAAASSRQVTVQERLNAYDDLHGDVSSDASSVTASSSQPGVPMGDEPGNSGGHPAEAVPVCAPRPADADNSEQTGST